MEFFYNLNHVTQALLATIFTWGITAIGAAIVFIFKKPNKNIMDAMLGFAAGVMIAASFWSLLEPSIEMANNLNMCSWIIASIGFLCGGILLFIGDKLFDHFDNNFFKKRDSFKRCLMLIFSITLHNIPEGLAIGVAFGSLNYGLEGATIASSLILALGIGLQNFPEGTAVSVPLSGALLVTKIRLLLPFLLAFAAGAMIYVVVQELIPESQSNKKKEIMALFTLIGFSIMMILDVALG